MSIQKKLLDILESNKTDAIGDVVSAGVSVVNPVSGFLITLFNKIVGLVDEIKVDLVIRGLSSGLNQETFINQMYVYISKSEENAFYIANSLRKAILSDSPIACTIMGRILADHIKDSLVYTQEDIIIVHALESATDEDIKIFVKIMEDYLYDNDIDKEAFHIPDELMKKTDYLSALDWCVYNRIINGFRGITWRTPDQDYDDTYSPTAVAHKLYKYYVSIKQVSRW